MARLGKYQTVGFTYWKGMGSENHIGAIFGKHPQEATKTMVELLAFHRGKTLETFLNKFPTKEFDTDDEYTWKVIGSSRRNIPLVEARDEDGKTVDSNYTGMVGAGTAPFYLVFAEDWFSDGEYIVGNLNEVYQFRILGDPKFEGSNAVYKVELAGGNTVGCPPERLLAGEKFSIEAAFVERELSRKVGDIHFASPVAMRNEWSQVRIQHKEPGSMLNAKILCGFPSTGLDGNGKKEIRPVWMHKVDYQLEEEFSAYKNNALAFGRSNRNANGEYMNIGKSGNVIKTGAGLYEQIEVSNTYYYNNFSLKLIEEALYNLSYSKIDLKDRKFVLTTGERGAALFHKAVLDVVSGWTQFVLDNNSTHVIQKTNSNLHQNSLRAGFQFTEFLAPMGAVIEVRVDPYYDDVVRNKIQHHLGGPAFSYRFDIFDIGTMDQPNIFKCQVKGKPEIRGYQWGMRNPFTGQIENNNMSYDEDSAVIHKMATLGICVLDPTRTVSFIPAELQA